MNELLVGGLIVFLLGYMLWFLLDYRRYNPGRRLNLVKVFHPKARGNGRHQR